MKKLSLLIIAGSLFLNLYAQNRGVKKTTNLELAKINVKKYLLKTLNDPSSYQPSEWGELTPQYRHFNAGGEYNDLVNTPIYATERIRLVELEIETQKQIGVKNENLSNEINQLLLRRDSLLLLKGSATKKLDSLRTNYRNSKIIGYSIIHRLRAKNAFGGLVLGAYTFVLDEKLQVLSSESD